MRKLKPTIHFGDGSRDTRGLPSTMDPHNFYEYRIQRLANNAQGLESVIYKMIPYDYIRSFAIAIDPLYKLKVSPDRIASPTRELSRYSLGIPYTKFGQADLVETGSGVLPGGCPGYGYERTTPVPYFDSGVYTGMRGSYKYVRDTTSRTRPFMVKYGECEIYHTIYPHPERTARKVSDGGVRYNSAFPWCVNRADWQRGTVNGSYTLSPAAYVTPSNAGTLRRREIQYANDLLAKNGLELIRRAMPTSRHDSLLRNIIELRDIPRSIDTFRRSLSRFSDLYNSFSDKRIRDSVFNLSNTRQVSNEYLSYQFGWRQLYSDLMSFLSQPAKITKRINYAIDHADKKATFTSQIKFSERDVTAVPPFTVVTTSWDNAPRDNTVVAMREVTLRGCVSGTFPFPPADVPKFRKELFQKMIGLDIQPGDLYDLVPWTWLVDWFSGLGNYLHIIQEINGDPTLIDHGFVSAKIHTNYTQTYRTSYNGSESFKIDNVNFGRGNYIIPGNTDFVLDMDTYVRKDASTIADVKSPASGNLTDFQKSILGALVVRRI